MKDEKLLAKHNKVWSEFKEIIERKKNQHCNGVWWPIFKNQNICNKKTITIFKNIKNNSSKSLKEGSQCFCLSAAVINSVFKSGKNFKKVFREDCKYKTKEKEINHSSKMTQKVPLMTTQKRKKKKALKKVLSNW